MWMCDEILLSIAGFLDFKGLVPLYRTCSKSVKALKDTFTKESHPSAVAYMARRIIEERRNGPRAPFEMIIRSGRSLHFTDLDENQTGRVTVFMVSALADKKSIRCETFYEVRNKEFSTVDSSIEVCIHPSETAPFKSGIMRIHRICDTATLDYSDGFDYNRVLALCPLQFPLGE